MSEQLLHSPLIDAVRALADRHPDAVYEKGDASGCSYTQGVATNGHMGCLIGQALVACGVTRSELRSVQTQGISDVVEECLFTERFGEADVSEEDWLRTVQDHQDDGWTWSDAVAYADGSREDLRRLTEKYYGDGEMQW